MGGGSPDALKSPHHPLLERAERAAEGRAADANRVKLKEQRLARDAAEKSPTPKGFRKEKPPTGTKGEEITSQGQGDGGTRRRTRRTWECEIAAVEGRTTNYASIRGRRARTLVERIERGSDPSC